MPKKPTKAKPLEATAPVKMGRPTVFKQAYVEQVRQLSLSGATDDEIARELNVDRFTLYRWKVKRKDFSDALKVGKEEADDRVEVSLYHKATGYTYEAEKIVIVNGKPEKVRVTEHVPPDTTAMIFWLKNRKVKEWRDRHEHTGPEGGPLQFTWLTEAPPDDPTR